MQIITSLLNSFRNKGINLRRLVDQEFESLKFNSIFKGDAYLQYFEDKTGIEIGGPSEIFSKEIPIYKVAQGLDGCNFSNYTIWEGNITEGKEYAYYKDKTGYQYICEASNLQKIPSEKYDFLIASHCLEHCANTLKTVKEWLRVIKKGGAIMMILPDSKNTFDHNRPITTFKHLLEDYKNNIDESDLTHLTEILELHDLRMDLPAGTIKQFKDRSLRNSENRCLHHHIFDFKLLHKICSFFDVKVIDKTFVPPYHQIIIGVKK